MLIFIHLGRIVVHVPLVPIPPNNGGRQDKKKTTTEEERRTAFTLGPVTFRANVEIHFREPEIPVLKLLRNKNSQRGLSSLKTAAHGWLNTSFLTLPASRIYTSVVKFYWKKRGGGGEVWMNA